MAASESAKEYYTDNMDTAVSDDSAPVEFAVVTKHHENFYEEALKLVNCFCFV